MNFVALDFETANQSRDSACSIGLAVVENGIITNTFYTLIKPKNNWFDPYNTLIHGITEEDVHESPEFNELWPKIQNIIGGKIVIAHNASFDISVLRHVLSEYNLDFPEMEYSCSLLAARATWPGLISYRLNILANKFGIPLTHHNALEDAKASAQIMLECFRDNFTNDFKSLHSKLQMSSGNLFKNGYTPARRKNSRGSGKKLDPASLVTTNNEFDESHPFFHSNIVFTGTLKSMARIEAMQKVVDLGGSCGKGVTLQTNFLIIGDADFELFSQGKKTSKLIKAENLARKGTEIEIISEQEFLSMI